jgi:hypothetical protein
LEVVIAKGDVKLRHLARDPHCGLVIFETVPPFRGVEVHGIPELVDEDVTAARTAIGGRYLGAEAGKRFAQERRARPGVLLRLHVVEPRVWSLIAEHVVALLTKGEPTVNRLPTPLTQGNRRADRRRRNGVGHEPAPPRPPGPEPHCKRCGGELPHRDRVYCNDCLPLYRREQLQHEFAKAGVAQLAALRDSGVDPTHGGQAAKKRGETQRRRQRERRQWDAANPGRQRDPETFTREILPALERVPLSELAQATGLSMLYVSQIRRGLKVPHARHWPRIRQAAGVIDAERTP